MKCKQFLVTELYSPTQGGIQFFIDALDRDVQTSGLVETEVFINHFAINLELEPGPTFTDRVNYTGIYNISDVEFDISFRVQCTENYFGPNCTKKCVSEPGEYTCDSEGEIVCIADNRDPATNCSSCLSGYNPLLNCLVCLQGRDLVTNCAGCLPGYDPSTGCLRCLPGYELTGGTQCTMQATIAPGEESGKHNIIVTSSSYTIMIMTLKITDVCLQLELVQIWRQ